MNAVTDIRVYLANLSAYNDGKLVGEWIDLPISEEDLNETLARIGNPDEYAIHDYEAPFRVGESDFCILNKFAEEWEDLRDDEKAKITYLLDDGETLESIVSDGLESSADTVQFYEGMTLEDVAAELVDEGCFGTIHDSIRNYIDCAAIGRDLRHDGYVETKEGVFRRDN